MKKQKWDADWKSYQAGEALPDQDAINEGMRDDNVMLINTNNV